MGDDKQTTWIVADDGKCMESFGSFTIFRPRLVSEVQVRVAAEEHLRASYPVGTYTDKGVINDILQHQFKFYTETLEAHLAPIASLECMDFVLTQYEHSARIESLLKRNELEKDKGARWAELGPVFRRAAKYLAELLGQLAPRLEAPAVRGEDLFTALDTVWICAEQLVDLYLLSDQTYLLFPDETVLEILPEGTVEYLTLEIHERRHHVLALQERIRLDTRERDLAIPTPSFQNDVSKHEEILGRAFRETLGLSYQDVLKTLFTLNDATQASDSVPFVHRACAIEQLSQYLGIAQTSIERALAGFSLTQEQLQGRKIWEPKQQFRAARRAFFEFPHPTGMHLIWSKMMAQECFLRLIEDAIFRQIPAEWENPVTWAALETLSNAAGAWFESVVAENLAKVGIVGERSVKRGIGQPGRRVSIPQEVGEIDFLGYAPVERLLVVVECKLVHSGFEPKYFRGDISDFISSKKAYATKFRKKVEWVQANSSRLCQALA